MRGIQFTIDRADRRELVPGEWWPEDLVGCDVFTVQGDSVGVVANVITGASQDRLVVETSDGSSAEIPFVAALVPEVDVENRRIVVDLPGGLLE
jgi:16S rRNA processing protein RimM